MNQTKRVILYTRVSSDEQKERLSIEAQEIEFDGKNYRTNSFNSVLGCIYENISLLQGQTETDSPVFAGKSAWVAPSELLSNRFLEDLDRIWALRSWIPDPKDPTTWK